MTPRARPPLRPDPASSRGGVGQWLAGATLCAALGACVGPQDAAGEPSRGGEHSEEVLRELLADGTLRPAAAAGEEAPGPEPRGRLTVEGMTQERIRPPAPDPLELAAPQGETLGLEPPPQVGAEEARPPQGPQPARPLFNPWAEFGSRIAYDAGTGLVTKPYPLRLKMGKKLFDLVQDYGGFEFHDPAQGPQEPSQLDLVLMEEFDTEAITADLRGALHVTATPIKVADWLVARAQPEVLREFEYFLNTFVSSPPQIEIEAKIVEVVTRDTFDMGVSDFLATLPEKALFNTIGFNLPNRSANELLLNVGTIHDGTQYSALIELLSTFENVSIISRPRSAVREGGRARVEAVERIPFLQVASVTAQGGFNTTLAYLEVGVRLFVTPRLVGSRVALEIDVEASQQTGDAVTVASADGEIVTTPILSTRQARTLVYLRPGEAVILGGLITERAVDQERKIPFIGDLPGIGALFRSTFQVKAKAQVLFFIRPRVMQGTDLSQEF